MRRRFSRISLVGLALAGAVACVAWLVSSMRSVSPALAAAEAQANSAEPSPGSDQVAPVRVETIKPQPGGLERTTTQPGTVIAFESARLYSKIPGYLKSLAVDIGDRVKRGDVLAEIDAPELLREVDLERANLAQTKAQVAQAEARVATAEAEYQASLAAIQQAEADIEKSASFRAFREKQYKRIDELFQSRSVEERLVDEKRDEMEAAKAAERLSHAGVTNAKAQSAAAAARIIQAKADTSEARAKVDVAASALAKSEVLAGYLQIVSPYDGVVTHRDFFRGDFIQSADKDARVPLLAVDRTDRMRVVVQVPDRDVPFTNPGDEAVVEIDALPGMQFAAKVARVADAEDTQSRTMRTEIDLPNDKHMLRQGMYGRVTIQLGTIPGAMRIPSSSVVGDVANGKGRVYVCRGDVARLTNVSVGQDDGLHVEVLNGLRSDDDVVRQPGTGLFDGARVAKVPVSSDAKANARPAKGSPAAAH